MIEISAPPPCILSRPRSTFLLRVPNSFSDDTVVQKLSRPRAVLRSIFRLALAATAIAVVLVASLAGWAYRKFRSDLPTNLDVVTDYRPLRASQIFSADGEMIGEFFVEKRVLVPIEKVPEVSEEGVRRRRGRPLLPAPRGRLPGHPARGLGQPARRPGGAGRLDDHPAGGEAPHRRRGALARAQGARGDPRATASRSSSPRTRSSASTSITSTSATARTASPPPRTPTSASRSPISPSAEAAMLAGAAQGARRGSRPSTDFPRAQARQRYVLDQMLEHGLADRRRGRGGAARAAGDWWPSAAPSPTWRRPTSSRRSGAASPSDYGERGPAGARAPHRHDAQTCAGSGRPRRPCAAGSRISPAASASPAPSATSAAPSGCSCSRGRPRPLGPDRLRGRRRRADRARWSACPSRRRRSIDATRPGARLPEPTARYVAGEAWAARRARGEGAAAAHLPDRSRHDLRRRRHRRRTRR